MKFRVLVFILIIGLFSCKDNQVTVKSDTKIRVKITVVNEREMAFPIRSSGKLALKEEMKLSFKTGGIINRIYAEEGTKVNKGVLLAELNMAEIQAAVEQAKLGLEKAERDFNRVNNLFKDSVATLEQLQNITTALGLAKSNYDIARFNEKYSIITAPDNGFILKRLVEKNEIIAPGYPVFIFASTAKDWIFRLNIPDTDIIKISLNDSAVVKFDAWPDKLFHAIVYEKANAADPYTGTFELELKMTGTNTQLISGLIGSVDILPSEKEKLIEIPYIAMVEGDQNECYVYILNESDLPVKKRLKIVWIGSESFFIRSGLKPGSRVVTDGAAYIKQNSEIEIVE